MTTAPGSSKRDGQEFLDTETSPSSRDRNLALMDARTSSAEDSPASLSAQQESEEVAPILDSYGQSSSGSFASLSRDMCWLRTSQGFCQSTLEGLLARYLQTWPPAGTVRSGTAYLRSPVGRGIGATASLSLPTPTAGEGMGTNPRQKLTDFARSGTPFPTPVSYDSTPGGPNNHYQGLGQMAKKGELNSFYPTPTAQRGMQGGQGCEMIIYRRVQDGTLPLEEALAMLGRKEPPKFWPTPVASDGGLSDQKPELWADQALKHQAKGVNKQLPLSIAVKLYGQVATGSAEYPTPNAFDADWDARSVQRRFDKDPEKQKLLLQAAMEADGTLWPTPTAAEAKQGPSSHPRHLANGMLMLSDLAMLHPTGNLPTSSDPKPESSSEPPTSPTGSRPTASGQLNPTWVEWLMGFPAGWTALDASEMRSRRRSAGSSGRSSSRTMPKSGNCTECNKVSEPSSETDSEGRS